MNLQKSLFQFIADKGLSNITNLSQKEKLQTLSKPEEVYNSLKDLELSDEVEFIMINNESYKSHLVLINNSIPIVCLGYNEKGEYEAFIPILPNCSKGINHQLFVYRYILFLRLSYLQTENEPSEITTGSKPHDQKMLERYLKAINGNIPMTEDLRSWWSNRY